MQDVSEVHKQRKHNSEGVEKAQDTPYKGKQEVSQPIGETTPKEGHREFNMSEVQEKTTTSQSVKKKYPG